MDNIKWVRLKGIAKVDNNSITYDSADQGYSEIRCNKFHLRGMINFKLSFNPYENSNNQPLMFALLLNYESDLPTVKIGMTSHGEFFIAQEEHKTWSRIASTGAEPSKKEIVTYNVKIIIIGSQIQVFVNEVLVCRARDIQMSRSQITTTFEGIGLIKLDSFIVTEDKQKAFVIMKFGGQFDYVYTEVIKPICEEFDVDCIRVDEYNYPGAILADIINGIKEADIILADITPDNPNVYFEVGYAFALGKNPILLMDKSRDKIPFDISGFRVLIYNNTIEGASQIKERLRKFIKTLTQQ